MSRLLQWGGSVWPGRWQQQVNPQDLNLLPWRRMRQWREWAALAAGVVCGAFSGVGLTGWIQWRDQDAVAHWQTQAQQLHAQTAHATAQVQAWQKRWVWQAQHDAQEAWRSQGVQALLQPMLAPLGPVLLRRMSWDGQQTQAEVWVVHPELALPWLERHWAMPVASVQGGGQQGPQSQTSQASWQAEGEWLPQRVEPGVMGQVGATVWQGRWQSPGRKPAQAARSEERT